MQNDGRLYKSGGSMKLLDPLAEYIDLWKEDFLKAGFFSVIALIILTVILTDEIIWSFLVELFQ